MSKAWAALGVCLMLAGAWPLAVYLEQSWLDEFRREEVEHDCCVNPNARPSCVEAVRHLRYAAAGVGDPAYVARLRLLECDPPPEVRRERAAKAKAEQDAAVERARLHNQQQANLSEARVAEQERQRAERERTLVPSAAAGCALLPAEARPAIPLMELARLAQPERDLRLREAVCKHGPETSEALLALSEQGKREVLCALPWPAALASDLRALFCVASTRAGCDVFETQTSDAGPEGEDPGRPACLSWEMQVPAFVKAGEQRAREALAQREQTLRAGPQTEQGRDERLLATLRLGFAESLLEEPPRFKDQVLARATLTTKEQEAPGPAELAALAAAFGPEPGAALASSPAFLRAEVPGEGPVLIAAPCESSGPLRSGLYWLSAKRSLTLRQPQVVTGEQGCLRPLDVLDLDGDGLPEVLAQDMSGAWVFSVTAEGARPRLQTRVHRPFDPEVGGE